MSSPRPGDMSAGFIGLAVSVLFLLAAVTTIIALTNRAFAGHAAAPQESHAAPAGQAAPPRGTDNGACCGRHGAAAHAPGAH